MVQAVDAKDGKELWRFKVGSGIGAPMTYRSGWQTYVAILSGIGGWSGLVVAGDLATDDPTKARRRWRVR